MRNKVLEKYNDSRIHLYISMTFNIRYQSQKNQIHEKRINSFHNKYIDKLIKIERTLNIENQPEIERKVY